MQVVDSKTDRSSPCLFDLQATVLRDCEHFGQRQQWRLGIQGIAWLQT